MRSSSYYVYVFSAIIAYFVAGRIGLLFDVGDTQSSPLWPPSAVGVLFMYFIPQAWPGIYIGALAANMTVFLDRGQDIYPALMMSAGIAIGNTIEVWLIGTRPCIHRLFSSSRNLFYMAGYAVVGCLIAAINGPLNLIMGGVIGWDMFLFVASTWFLGDLNAIVVFVPCVLAWRKFGCTARYISGFAFFAIIFIIAEQIIHDLSSSYVPMGILMAISFSLVTYIILKHDIHIGLSMIIVFTVIALFRITGDSVSDRVSVHSDETLLIYSQIYMTLLALSMYPIIGIVRDRVVNGRMTERGMKIVGVTGSVTIVVTVIVMDVILKL